MACEQLTINIQSLLFIHSIPEITYNHIEVSIQDLGWPTIEELIHRETSVMAFKCLNKLAPDYLSSCIFKLSDRHTREL